MPRAADRACELTRDQLRAMLAIIAPYFRLLDFIPDAECRGRARHITSPERSTVPVAVQGSPSRERLNGLETQVT